MNRRAFVRRILAGVAAAQFLGADLLDMADAAAQEALPALEEGGWYRLTMIHHTDGYVDLKVEDMHGRQRLPPGDVDVSADDGWVTLTMDGRDIVTIGGPPARGEVRVTLPQARVVPAPGIRTMAEMVDLPHA